MFLYTKKRALKAKNWKNTGAVYADEYKSNETAPRFLCGTEIILTLN